LSHEKVVLLQNINTTSDDIHSQSQLDSPKEEIKIEHLDSLENTIQISARPILVTTTSRKQKSSRSDYDELKVDGYKIK
jgi:hypothetical protein